MFYITLVFYGQYCKIQSPHLSPKNTVKIIMHFSGWQPRWFVLDGGTLSYYDSQEDAWKGCKGSIKISVCEIQGLYGLLSCVYICKSV